MEFARERKRIEGYNFSGAENDDQDDKQHRFTIAASPSSSSSSPSASSSSWSAATVAPHAENPSPSASSSAAQNIMVEKEHMFDKVVTPSDVGKLNRLVIPKQHAEKYFPLDTTTHEKGLLLCFEDRTGKPWRFRYSYWNSSQSYVMTKGWSRFVKEKRLDAGDTVSFSRGVDDKDRLFIDWKRRPEIHDPPRLPRIPLPLPSGSNYHNHHHHPMVSFSPSLGPWAGRLLVPPQAAAAVYDHHHRQNYVYNAAAGSGGGGAQYLVFRSAVAPPQGVVQLGSGFSFSSGERDGSIVGGAAPMVLDSVPVAQSQAAAKRVRLFGVNLDLAPESNGDPGDSSIRSLGSAGFTSSSSPSPKGKEKEQHPSLDLDT